MTSYDAEKLFPSVPIGDALKVIEQLMREDPPKLKDGVKLEIDDIIGLLELCLSTTNFIYNGRHHTTKDSGPIGLSLMVPVSQIWMTYTLDQSMAKAQELGA